MLSTSPNLHVQPKPTSTRLRRVRSCAVCAAAEPATATPPVVFVAGATGRTGIRVVRALLEAGCTVRAGVRDVAKATALFAGGQVCTGARVLAGLSR